MLSRKRLVFSLLIIFLFGCSNNKSQKIIIVFEKPPTLKQAQELILNLSSNASNKNLFKLLDNQKWINSFLIKKHAFKPIKIFIDSKEPKYIWQESFYLDAKLSKFLYFGEYSDLLHLNMPIEFVDNWLEVEEEIYALTSAYKLKISSISYSEAEGWHFKTKSNLKIKLGSNLSSKELAKLPLAFKYIFEKNLTPSIIDLRYKDGAALNYGK
ncbi:cell division protein FtsQ [Gammaproteobacteria bacterium]|nr:cell division protein FtsQ [Gammaproteobacteria bacterium]